MNTPARPPTIADVQADLRAAAHRLDYLVEHQEDRGLAFLRLVALRHKLRQFDQDLDLLFNRKRKKQ